MYQLSLADLPMVEGKAAKSLVDLTGDIVNSSGAIWDGVFLGMWASRLQLKTYVVSNTAAVGGKGKGKAAA
jgi:hypothetical protein